MKLLILMNLTSDASGARLHLFCSMIERGHDVVVAIPGLMAAKERDPLKEIGVACEEYPLSRAGLNPVQEWRSYRAMLGLIRKYKPDLVLSMTIKPVIYGTLAAAKSGVKRRFAHITGLGYAFTGPRSGKRALVGKLVEHLYRRALAKADIVFFENRDDLSLFVERQLVAPDKTVVIDGSGIDLDHFAPRPWPEGSMRFLFAGRLLGSKGLPELVESFRRVRADHPDVKLQFAGPLDVNPDAVSKETLDRWVAEGVVDYLGVLPDIRLAMAAAHVFVLPSHREGLPRGSMEAMATGRALITTDAPGCRETVEDGRNGLMVPVGDIDAIERALRWMIDHPEDAKAMGQASLDIVKSRFSADQVNAQLLEAMGL